MKRTAVSLEAPILMALKQLAEEGGVSVDALIREGVEQKLANHQPGPKSIGIGASAQRDTAMRSSDDRPDPRP